MIEAFGTGIPRIFSAYENAHAKPEIPIIVRNGAAGNSRHASVIR